MTLTWGMRLRSWLRHCVARRKIAGSIQWDFSLNNPPGYVMVLESTQPLTEMSTWDISWGYRSSVLRAENLTTYMCRFSGNLGALTSWRPVQFCSGIALAFVYGINLKFQFGGVEKWPHFFLTLILGGDSGQLYAAAIVHSESN
jgi:hypothetical protein